LIKVPPQVKLYLRPNTDGTYLLKLHNMNTVTPASVIFPEGWTLKELTLNGNQFWADWTKKQFKWNTEASCN